MTFTRFSIVGHPSSTTRRCAVCKQHKSVKAGMALWERSGTTTRSMFVCNECVAAHAKKNAAPPKRPA
jgi:hypothetical protein